MINTLSIDGPEPTADRVCDRYHVSMCQSGTDIADHDAHDNDKRTLLIVVGVVVLFVVGVVRLL